MVPKRQRRRAEDAREMILTAAEKRLIAAGPDAIRVQVIARDVGLTDAAVHHHFGSRNGLLDALLRFAGRRLKSQIVDAVARWEPGAFDVRELIDLIGQTYIDRGYARLALWMALAGWKPHGTGMFRPLAEAIHAMRVERARATGVRVPDQTDSLFAVVLINLVLMAEPLAGSAQRAASGLPADRATARRFRKWFAALLQQHLGDAPPSSVRIKRRDPPARRRGH